MGWAQKETAEAYVKEMVHSFNGNGPTEDLPDLGDTDAEAYILQRLAE